MHFLIFYLNLTDEEIKKLGIPEHAIEMFRRTRYQANFGIDTWYDKLEEYTFKTTQFDLTWEEADALARPDRLRTAEDACAKKLFLSRCPGANSLAPFFLFSVAMSGLIVGIDRILSQWRKKGVSSVFVKLSTRSPKDVTVYGK